MQCRGDEQGKAEHLRSCLVHIWGKKLDTDLNVKNATSNMSVRLVWVRAVQENFLEDVGCFLGFLGAEGLWAWQWELQGSSLWVESPAFLNIQPKIGIIIMLLCKLLSGLVNIQNWSIYRKHFKMLIYLFLTALGLSCCMGTLFVAVAGGSCSSLWFTGFSLWRLLLL